MNQYLRRKIWTLNRSGKFRGYLRTVSGYPVTLTDCMVGQPVSLAVDGNAVQDGTPTPDNPVDVQLCGDRTVNLFDETLVEGKIGTQNADLDFIEDGKTYSVTCVGNGNGIMLVRGLTSENDGTGTEISVFRNVKGQVIRTFTADLTTYVKYIIRYYYSEKNDIHNIMIIKGAYTAETMPAYEPHGYKVSGQVEGLNLLSSAFEQGNIDANTGENTTNNIRIRTIDHIKCKPNTVYTIYSPYPVIGVREYDINKTYTGVWSSTVSSVTYTFTTSKNTEYLRFITQSQDGTVPDMTLPYMLVQGAYTAETMPAYEPYREPQTFNIYTPQQLAKVGDTADKVVLDFDNKTAELRKNVGSMVVSGGYSGATSAANTLLVRFYHVTKPNRKVSANANVIDIAADIFEAETFNKLGSAFTSKQYAISGNVNTSVFNVTVPKTAIGGDTNELMNAWAAEHPATVYYPIATPITTDITALQDWDAMPPLWSGTAEITADTVIAPNAITAKYYASKPEEVN